MQQATHPGTLYRVIGGRATWQERESFSRPSCHEGLPRRASPRPPGAGRGCSGDEEAGSHGSGAGGDTGVRAVAIAVACPVELRSVGSQRCRFGGLVNRPQDRPRVDECPGAGRANKLPSAHILLNVSGAGVNLAWQKYHFDWKGRQLHDRTWPWLDGAKARGIRLNIRFLLRPLAGLI